VTISTLTRLVTLLLEVQKYSSGERHNGGEAGAADGISSTRHRRPGIVDFAASTVSRPRPPIVPNARHVS
jgi:hypothetical protein